MPIKDNTQYELVLFVRVEELKDLPAIAKEAIKRVKKITEEKLDEVGGEESGASACCSGWYDFNLRDRDKSPDDPLPTKLPIRLNATEGR